MPAPGEMTAAALAFEVELAAMSPAEQLPALREFARVWGTLPRPLPQIRRTAIRVLRAQAKAEGRSYRWLAEQYNIQPNRFYRLARVKSVAA